jgi:hypothetical protein
MPPAAEPRARAPEISGGASSGWVARHLFKLLERYDRAAVELASLS